MSRMFKPKFRVGKWVTVWYSVVDNNFHGPNRETLTHGFLLVHMLSYAPTLGVWRYRKDGSCSILSIALSHPRFRRETWPKDTKIRVRLPWRKDA